jgi:hypothetical protein
VGDDPDPEAGQGLVVEPVLSVLGGEAPDAFADGARGLLRAQLPDLHPGQPQVVAMVELRRGDVPALEGVQKLLVGDLGTLLRP